MERVDLPAGCQNIDAPAGATFLFTRSNAGIGLSMYRLTDGTKRAYTSNWDKPRRRLLYYREDAFVERGFHFTRRTGCNARIKSAWGDAG